MKKVIIIGAGPAGLTAAYELLTRSKDYEVIILEETNAIGGISQTINHNGNRMDIGGHRFFSKDERVNEWWNNIMPLQGKGAYDDIKLGRIKPFAEDGPDPEQEDRVMLIRDRVSRIYYLKKFFDYPVSLKLQTLKNMGLKRTVKVGFSYLKTLFHKLDETSLENFYINRFGKELYSLFFEKYTEKLWGRHPRDIASDWGAQRVKGLSISAVIKDMLRKIIPVKKNSRKVETSLIEQFYYPKYGPGHLWETVANEVEKHGGTIFKNSKVIRIYQNNGQIVSVDYINNGDIINISCDILISSMPIKDLLVALDGAPQEMVEIAQGLPYRDFVTVGLLVKKLNLKNETKIKTLNNIIPDCWIYVQDEGVKLGRIQIFNNWSPYMVKDVENTVWLGLEYFCNEGDSFWNLSDNECIQLAVNELIKICVICEDTQILDSIRVKMKKAYPAYFDTYKDIDKVIHYLNTIPNIYCVGRNGQHRYNNMDHSMVTAFETVHNILNNIPTKDNIWNVNTEKEYHETKK
ncbi:MAG: NAD(P)/FAD-dependent oxidoreductase [Bacilli bacterium]|nr:NAD(P)/FAD-dependent oxidoreductase [Bacilli bacterium]